MFRSLHMKLTLILLLLITSLMAVVGAFLTTSVTSFYIDSFYQQMSSAFGADRREFVADLRSAAAQPDGAERIQEIMEVNAGMLGIDYRTRNYYVLDGTAGSFLAGSAESSDLPREQSANLLTARNAVSRKDASTVGDESDISADYMDVAIPIFGGDNAFIIYILDNKDTVSDLNNQLFQIIMQALIIGLLISVLLSFLLSKTMVGPIEKLTIGAERVAAGDFDSELPVESTDEIGILTGTFNEMAEVLQSTLAAVENERNKLAWWPLTGRGTSSTATPPPRSFCGDPSIPAAPTRNCWATCIPSRTCWPSRNPTTLKMSWWWETGPWPSTSRPSPTRPRAAF